MKLFRCNDSNGMPHAVSYAEAVMRTRYIAIAAVVASGLFATGAAAQHEGHQPDPIAPASAVEKAGPVVLVDRLVKSLAAIEAETDPAALKLKLAEHGVILKELQGEIRSDSEMKAKMKEMMEHMMGGGHKQ
jgi:hypothetical protein